MDIGCEAGREEGPEPARGALHRLAREVATLPPGAGLEALWSIAGDRATLDAPLIARRRRYPVLLAAAACVLVLGSWVAYVQVNDELKRASTACRDRGIAKECTQAGFLHWKQHDDAEAAQDWHLGCIKGSALSCAYLGVTYALGRGHERDMQAAVQLYTTSCNKGEQFGCAALGACLASGDGIARDMPRARKLFADACASGEPAGCENQAFDWDAWYARQQSR